MTQKLTDSANLTVLSKGSIDDVVKQFKAGLEQADIGTGPFHMFGKHDGIIKPKEVEVFYEHALGHKLDKGLKHAIEIMFPKHGETIEAMTGKVEKALHEVDTNHDGKLSKQEIDAVRARELPNLNHVKPGEQHWSLGKR